MAQLIAGAIAGPAAAEAVAAYSQARNQNAPGAAPQLADASSMLTPTPSFDPSAGTQMAQAQPVDNSVPQMQQPQMPNVDSQQQSQAPAPQPVDNPYADDTPQQLANDIGTPDNQPIEVKGDGWKPHKESVLAQIGDYLLQRRGMDPLFKQTNDRRNLTAALQGMDKDPQQAISRVRQFNPDMAYKMQQSYEQLHKDDEERAARTELIKAQLQDRMANAIGSIKTPQAYAKILPVLKQQAERLGIAPPPDTFDPDLIEAYRYQGYKTKDQVSQQSLNSYRNSRLGQFQESIDNTQSYRGARLGQMSASQQEQERHNRAIESKTGRTQGPRYVGTKYGPGVLSKDGYKLQVTVGGKTHTYNNVGPGKWRLQEEDDEE